VQITSFINLAEGAMQRSMTLSQKYRLFNGIIHFQ
jgi:hypothetical protein